MDIAGVALQGIDFVAQLLNTIYNQYRAYLENPSRWLELAHNYTEAKKSFESINEKLQNWHSLSEETKSVFRDALNSINSTLAKVRKELEQTETRWQIKVNSKHFAAAHKFFPKFARALHDENILRSVTTQLESVMARIERREIRMKLEELGYDIEARLAEISISRNHDDVQAFKPIPGGDAVINIEFLALDYNSTDDNNEPLTMEGKLKARVLQSGTNRSVGVFDPDVMGHSDAKVTGAVGGGGVGKTCAVRGLAKDREIQETFSGGIYEFSLGQDAQKTAITGRLRTLIQLTGGKKIAEELANTSDLNAHIVKACEWFGNQGHPCLFLVDDVWENNEIDATVIRELSKITDACNGRVVFTSRDQSLSEVADEVIEFNARGTYSKEATAMLLCKARMSEDDVFVVDSKSNVREVLKICDGLPAALAVAGQLAHEEKPGGDPWGSLLRRLGDSVESLWTERPKGYRALSKLLDAALNFLDQKRGDEDSPRTYSFGDMAYSLCVLERQQFAPVSMLCRLWQLNLESTLRVMRQMCNVGIITQDYGCADRRKQQEREKGLRIHDLVNEYFAFKADIAQRKTKYHTRLLDNYLKGSESWNNCGKYRKWWTLRDDLYICANVCRHLAAGGCKDELLHLLLDPCWTVLSLTEYGIWHLKQDHDLAIQVLEDHMTAEDEKIKALGLVMRAAQLSFLAVSKNHGEVWYQLYGRLVSLEEGNNTVKGYLKSLEKHATRPWIRPGPGILRAPGCAMTETLMLPRTNMKALDVAIQNDCTILVVLIDNGGIKLKLWRRRPNASEEVKSLSNSSAPPSRSHSASFSTDGRLCATSHENCSVIIWNTDTGTKKFEMTCGEGSILSPAVFAWSMGGERLAVIGNKSVYVWETQNGERVGALPGELVQSIALSPDGSRIVIARDNSGAYVYVVESGLVERKIDVQHSMMGNSSFGYLNRWKTKWIHWFASDSILAYGLDPVFKRFDGNGRQTGEQRGSGNRIICSSSSTNEHLTAYLTSEGALKVLDASSFASVGKVHLANNLDGYHMLKPNGIHDGWRLAFSQNGSKLVCLIDSKNEENSGCYVVDPRRLPVAKYNYYDEVTAVRFSDDGKWLACGLKDGSFQVWNTSERVAEIKFEGARKPSASCETHLIEWSADGCFFAAVHDDGIVRIWDWRNKRQIGSELSVSKGSQLRYASGFAGRLQFVANDDGSDKCVIVNLGGSSKSTKWEYMRSAGVVELRALKTVEYEWQSRRRTSDQEIALTREKVQLGKERLGSIEVRDASDMFGVEASKCDKLVKEDGTKDSEHIMIALSYGSEVYFLDLFGTQKEDGLG